MHASDVVACGVMMDVSQSTVCTYLLVVGHVVGYACGLWWGAWGSLALGAHHVGTESEHT